ncbi:unnamed protein product [Durusdinium trenchii]|uniref:Uncharacterized protein n=1 Tax=Durusdinium trenchii TaxID=1381693 RepID=A0ABP0PQ63_9DINO
MTQALRSKLGCFQGAVSVVMSKRWSCDTLRVGFGEVMDDAMADEESKLLKEIEEIEARLGQVCPSEITMEPPKELPSVEQQVIEPSPVATTADTTVPEEEYPLSGVDEDPYNDCDDDEEPPENEGTNHSQASEVQAFGDDAEEEPVPGSKPRREQTRREKLQLAAKARIRRMVASKKKRTDLEVPMWVIQEWSKGTKARDNMAEVLQRTNWDKDKFLVELEKVVTSRQTITIKKDEGWYSEYEMKNDLKWSASRIAGAKKYCESKGDSHCRRNCYDGVMEYWVCVRESGSHEESLEVLETKRSREQAQESKLEIAPDSFKAVNAYKERGSDLAASGADNAASMSENKLHVKRFMDSLLGKATKLKSCLKDLNANFTQESTASYTKSLNDNIKTLDTEFDKLNDLVAEGENSDFGKEWWGKAEKQMKSATYSSSRAAALELKIRKSKPFLEKKGGERKDKSDAPPRKRKNGNQTAGKAKAHKEK